MNTKFWAAGLGLWSALVVPALAFAQAPAAAGPSLQPSRRPTISPYLSLLGGPSAAGQYYRQVRPDFQFYQTGRELRDVTRELRTGLEQTRQDLAGPQPLSELTPTGYGAGFLTHQRYFNRFPAGPGAAPFGSRPVRRAPLGR